MREVLLSGPSFQENASRISTFKNDDGYWFVRIFYHTCLSTPILLRILSGIGDVPGWCKIYYG